jgi:hypothetical protein
MPVERLWHCLREEVTCRTCYDNRADLIAQVFRFLLQINTDPLFIADHLWVKSHLISQEETLRISS